MKKEENQGLSLEIHLTHCGPGPGKNMVGKFTSLAVLYISYSQIS